ncbi:tRNA-dihydrouridine synthase family protein [Akkermansiaceae bacterium]|nr:tRNA-dihydrouridine synthase family protein [Akkermansiaceae bacterium]MDB4809273.1 tRNA-dihydrouridine synthase family protein [bacterium]MDA7933709.1 tRNA-dihydrouridine synthase family protein [Akkermansiaceae bacterium]MDA9829974.1 tRNA-dihydrouridine synthase family protein [Akkermansiaceae bacterium]MDB4510197.1 tRNA-dihydrouridine synthase family protein [Akkermansiaceae bacterium]
MLPSRRPALFLAPMQDVTDLPFLRTIASFGGADLYVTEYFRVHIHSRLDPYILRSITENPTGRPIIAQMIGQDASELARTACDLKNHPIAGIDLNLGCPAPVVYRKNAGGGLLRHPDQVHEILGRLREACSETTFTVKTRVGFESEEEFDQLLEIFKSHDIDLLTIHGRTVKERYQTPVHDDRVAHAVRSLGCPVIANGNVVNCQTGLAYLKSTEAAGLMIGRGAIRNPWIFEQLRCATSGREIPKVTGRMILEYITKLYDETAREIPEFVEDRHVQKMKKYLIYISQGFDADFEHQIRRVKNKTEFFATCARFLDHGDPAPDLPSENSRLFCGFSQFL